MKRKKIDNHFNEEYRKIMDETRENKAFNLGYARGMFELYAYIADENGVEYSDKLFYSISKSSEYFQKYVELYKEENNYKCESE